MLIMKKEGIVSEVILLRSQDVCVHKFWCPRLGMTLGRSKDVPPLQKAGRPSTDAH